MAMWVYSLTPAAAGITPLLMMQNTKTGELTPLSDHDAKALGFATTTDPDMSDYNPGQFPVPEGERGPIFVTGEMVEIKGGKFVVQNIGKKMMVVRGVPGTHVQDLTKLLKKARKAHGN